MNEISKNLELFDKYVFSKGRKFNESSDNKRAIINDFIVTYNVPGGGIMREALERMYDALLIKQKKGNER